MLSSRKNVTKGKEEFYRIPREKIKNYLNIIWQLSISTSGMLFACRMFFGLNNIKSCLNTWCTCFYTSINECILNSMDWCGYDKLIKRIEKNVPLESSTTPKKPVTFESEDDSTTVGCAAITWVGMLRKRSRTTGSVRCLSKNAPVKFNIAYTSVNVALGERFRLSMATKRVPSFTNSCRFLIMAINWSYRNLRKGKPLNSFKLRGLSVGAREGTRTPTVYHH